MKEGYIKREDRKKILLITDDIRVHSGVGQIGREIVTNTAHHFNWIQLAGSIDHPEKGKILDLSGDTNKLTGIDDSSVYLYPCDGYGNPELLRTIIKREKPDAIFLITDPRYFIWLFQMESELRKTMPIIYLNIWDDLPVPHFNREYYESSDLLLAISKQTKFINQSVLSGGEVNYLDLDTQIGEIFDEDKPNKRLLKYVPHGLDNKIFKPLNKKERETQDFKNFQKSYTRGNDKEFVLLFNSRNIRRKSIPDTILAWKFFMDTLSREEQEKCTLILHTEAVSEHGTDIPATIDYFFPEWNNITLSTQKLNSQQMNYLYNVADGVILLSSNEGWGLSLTEALLTATPFIANTTGGMQDQMRFEDEDGNWFTPNSDVPSNHKGTYTKCGNWALNVFPGNNSIQGSPVTPYIYDDRCSAEDAHLRIIELYNMSKAERQKIGNEGMEWALGEEAGFTSKQMADKVVEGVDELFKTWGPRETFEFLSDSDYKVRTLNHKMKY